MTSHDAIIATTTALFNMTSSDATIGASTALLNITSCDASIASSTILLNMTSRDATIAASTALLIATCTFLYNYIQGKRQLPDSSTDLSVLPCILARRSVFPSAFHKDPPPLDDSIIRSLLDAALWSPFHGRCYKGNQHPARFVVLGKQSVVEMQKMTLQYYDRNWKEKGWGSGTTGTEAQYQAWRKMTEDEITGRWAPCSHMIAIVMRRQAGPKRFPEWEEAAATAAATQNMHLQATKFPQLACYWSSWHNAVRDSDEMKEFLNMNTEDKCFGFFIVAQVKPRYKDRRKMRDRSLMDVEWRQ